MKKIAWGIALVAAIYVVLALAIDGVIAVSQPELEPGAAEGVLRVLDADGTAYEKRLLVIDDEGTLWVQSGHHFRGWYHRLQKNPEVELVRNGETRRYTAVPDESPEAKQHIKELLIARGSALRFYLIRTILLFAEVKPVRLDPRP